MSHGRKSSSAAGHLARPQAGAQFSDGDLFVNNNPGCLDSDCEFRITVDVNNRVNEGSEGNNLASGTCPD